MSTKTLLLPYPEITQTPSRDTLRAALKVSGNKNGSHDTYWVKRDNIIIRPGFNVRQQPAYMTDEQWLEFLQIKELAEGLLAGKENPEIIKGDFAPDGIGFILSDGYRRYLATGLIIEMGHEFYPNGRRVDELEVRPNPKEFTELDRVRQMFTSNHNLKLSPTQNAELCYRLKTYFNLTSQQVADNIGGITRQWVDNMLLIHEVDDDIKALLDNGTATITEVLKRVRDEKRSKKDTERREQVNEDMQLGMVDMNSGEVIETKMSLEEEIKSRKTDGSYKTPKEKNDQDLPGKDWTKEQEECIFNCSSIIGNSDKIAVRVSILKINDQDKKDLERLLEFNAKNAEFIRDTLAKVKFK